MKYLITNTKGKYSLLKDQIFSSLEDAITSIKQINPLFPFESYHLEEFNEEDYEFDNVKINGCDYYYFEIKPLC